VGLMMGNEQKLVLIVANVLKLDESLISDDTSPGNAKNWDSFNMMNMAVEIEKAFNITIAMDDLVRVTCFGDFRRVLEKCGVIF
jgi:acyl carrier protein